jgi:hypothetical protein
VGWVKNSQWGGKNDEREEDSEASQEARGRVVRVRGEVIENRSTFATWTARKRVVAAN